jgi:hypothetical protein
MQTVPYSTVSNTQPPGCIVSYTTQGHIAAQAPDGWHVDDATAFQNFVGAYPASPTELAWHKQNKQAALDTLFDANFVLTEFIRNGTVTTVTGANVGAFIAQISNNYRTLRASIAAATTVAQVQAININAGWPSNP